jgi:hypothetical protein
MVILVGRAFFLSDQSYKLEQNEQEPLAIQNVRGAESSGERGGELRTSVKCTPPCAFLFTNTTILLCE